MQNDVASATERSRLEALRAAGLTADCLQREMATILARAQDTFQAPTVLLSAVGESEQVFPARLGLDVDRTSRDASFCAHLLDGRRELVVTDATQDDRFSTNVLVNGDPHIRFYAGVGVHLPDGERLGALCVIDDRPRPDVGPEQLDELHLLAGFAQVLLQVQVLTQAA